MIVRIYITVTHDNLPLLEGQMSLYVFVVAMMLPCRGCRSPSVGQAGTTEVFGASVLAT